MFIHPNGVTKITVFLRFEYVSRPPIVDVAFVGSAAY
jgi:hypothetical protein